MARAHDTSDDLVTRHERTRDVAPISVEEMHVAMTDRARHHLDIDVVPLWWTELREDDRLEQRPRSLLSKRADGGRRRHDLAQRTEIPWESGASYM